MLKKETRNMEPRPTTGSNKSWELVKDKIIKYIKKCPFFEECVSDNEESDDFANDVFEYIKNNCRFELDGYRIAKSIDEKFMLMNMSAQDVEELDNMMSLVFEGRNIAIKEWVAKNNITIPYSVGDNIRFSRNGKIKEDLSGEITSIQPDMGTVLVYCTQLGHVRQQGCGTQGVYVDIENVISKV